MGKANTETYIETSVLSLLQAADALERRIDCAMSNTRGISYSEFRLLRALSRSIDRGYPRIELAQAVGLTASAVTRALKPLEKLGYVTTEKNGRDARQSLAKITPAGLDLLDDAGAVWLDIINALPLKDLSRKKIDEFQSLMNDIKTNY